MYVNGSIRGKNWRDQTSESDSDNPRSSLNPSRKYGTREPQTPREMRREIDQRVNIQGSDAIESYRRRMLRDGMPDLNGADAQSTSGTQDSRTDQSTIPTFCITDNKCLVKSAFDRDDVRSSLNSSSIDGHKGLEVPREMTSILSGNRMNAQEASAVLAAYMRENGNRLLKLNLNQLEQLSLDEKVPPNVRQAAKYLFDHPEAFKRIGASDGTTSDGTVGLSDFERVAEGGLVSNDNVRAQPIGGSRHDNDANEPVVPNASNVNRPTNGPMNGQKASGIMAAYMHKNNMETLDWDGLYKLMTNTSDSVPQQVQQAAKYLWEHREELAKIAALDPDSTTDTITAKAFDRSVTAEGSTAGSMSATSASGIMAAYMRENGIPTLNMNELRKLADDKDTPPRVKQAVNYLLKHLDDFKRIEASDGTTPDGTVGLSDFEREAEGGLVSNDNVRAQPIGGSRHDSDANEPVVPNASNVNRPANGPMNGQKASGIMAAYMHKNNMETLDWDGLYKLMTNTSGSVPPQVQQAAKYLWKHREELAKIAALDPDSTTDTITAKAFDRSVTAEGSTAGSMSATSASGIMAAYMRENGIPTLNMNELRKLADDKDTPPRVKQAVNYLLKHLDDFKRIEASDGTTPDGTVGLSDFEREAEQGPTHA
ncbi:HrpF/NolX family T3SS translocon protein [Burkholderia pyrrocinia]|uniref:HrpF/NolX family T3SS translocon protein n=1 Tax=Burkholderia pyrrocinia TaxID=60550 RepID=UPI00158EB7CB|nr:HrpF/NolX family T3SS translocon protein [Burkholderia pyrrocinia]